MARTTAAPTGGTLLAAAKGLTSDPDPVCVARQAPTATAATGSLWAGLQGLVLTGGLLTAPVSSPAQVGTVFDGAEIILLPGEAILVYAEANTTNWQHLVILEWKERA